MTKSHIGSDRISKTKLWKILKLWRHCVSRQIHYFDLISLEPSLAVVEHPLFHRSGFVPLVLSCVWQTLKMKSGQDNLKMYIFWFDLSYINHMHVEGSDVQHVETIEWTTQKPVVPAPNTNTLEREKINLSRSHLCHWKDITGCLWVFYYEKK